MNKAIHVLYVEDNEGDVELLKMSLERYCTTFNIILDIAETVEDAKNLFQPNKHILALIDWNLPDGEGIDVVQFIRTTHQNFPIYLLSGLITERHLQLVEKYNLAACLKKDYNKGFVDHVINQLELIHLKAC